MFWFSSESLSLVSSWVCILWIIVQDCSVLKIVKIYYLSFTHSSNNGSGLWPALVIEKKQCLDLAETRWLLSKPFAFPPRCTAWLLSQPLSLGVALCLSPMACGHKSCVTLAGLTHNISFPFYKANMYWNWLSHKMELETLIQAWSSSTWQLGTSVLNLGARNKPLLH